MWLDLSRAQCWLILHLLHDCGVFFVRTLSTSDRVLKNVKKENNNLPLPPLYSHTHTHKMFLVPQLLLFYLSHVHFLKIIYSLRNLAINKKKIFIRAADTLKKNRPLPSPMLCAHLNNQQQFSKEEKKKNLSSVHYMFVSSLFHCQGIDCHTWARFCFGTTTDNGPIYLYYLHIYTYYYIYIYLFVCFSFVFLSIIRWKKGPN